jgi:small subunit ribosomal protein S16
MLQFLYKIQNFYWKYREEINSSGSTGLRVPAVELKIEEFQYMVTIRLSRAGAKKRPFYHLVVTDNRNRRDGRYIERLGFFNPLARAGEVRLNFNRERLDYWLSQGAQISERVASLMRQQAKANP